MIVCGFDVTVVYKWSDEAELDEIVEFSGDRGQVSMFHSMCKSVLCSLEHTLHNPREQCVFLWPIFRQVKHARSSWTLTRRSAFDRLRKAEHRYNWWSSLHKGYDEHVLAICVILLNFLEFTSVIEAGLGRADLYCDIHLRCLHWRSRNSNRFRNEVYYLWMYVIRDTIRATCFDPTLRWGDRLMVYPNIPRVHQVPLVLTNYYSRCLWGSSELAMTL